MDFKIITFKVFKDPEEWYARSDDSIFVLGHILDYTAPSREELINTLTLDVNDIFFQEYEIDVFTTEDGPIEILLSRGVPVINNKYVL